MRLTLYQTKSTIFINPAHIQYVRVATDQSCVEIGLPIGIVEVLETPEQILPQISTMKNDVQNENGFASSFGIK